MAVLIYPVSPDCFLSKETLNTRIFLHFVPMERSTQMPVCHQLSSLTFSKFPGPQKLLTMNGSPPTEVDHQVKL